jgi:hypothetical protein
MHGHESLMRWACFSIVLYFPAQVFLWPIPVLCVWVAGAVFGPGRLLPWWVLDRGAMLLPRGLA